MTNPFIDCDCPRRDRCIYLYNEMIGCKDKRGYAIHGDKYFEEKEK